MGHLGSGLSRHSQVTCCDKFPHPWQIPEKQYKVRKGFYWLLVWGPRPDGSVALGVCGWGNMSWQQACVVEEVSQLMRPSELAANHRILLSMSHLTSARPPDSHPPACTCTLFPLSTVVHQIMSSLRNQCTDLVRHIKIHFHSSKPTIWQPSDQNTKLRDIWSSSANVY